MYVDTEDRRPPSLFDRKLPSVVELVGGVVTMVGGPLALAVVVALAGLIMTVLGSTLGGSDDAPPAERHIVEARFVQLGKEPDPNKLPNRQVPRKSTAPPEGVAPSKNPKEREERPDAGPPPPNAEDDLMRRLGDRAQAFAEIAEEREREGSPDGIEGGTAEEARAGDLYAGKLYAFFRRGWSVPTVISDAERRDLTTVVDIDIGDDLTIRDVRVRKESGNALFDQSVIDRIRQLQEADATLPEPPDEVRDDYVGKTIGLRFRGKDAS